LVGLDFIKDMNEKLEQTVDPKFRGIVLGDRDDMRRFLEYNISAFWMLHKCKQRLFSFAAGFALYSGHLFFEPYNDHINYFIASGSAQKSFSRYYERLKEPKNEQGPQELSMDHLGAAFVICFIPAMVALVIFIGELCLAKKASQRKATPVIRRTIKAKPVKKRKYKAKPTKKITRTQKARRRNRQVKSKV